MIIKSDDAALSAEMANINKAISERSARGVRAVVFWDLNVKTVQALRDAGYAIEDNLQSSTRSRDCYTIRW